MPVKGLPSSSRSARRASAAAFHASTSVIAFAQRHAAAGFWVPEGIAHAEPLANAMGSPSVVRTVSNAIGASGDTSFSTLMYHCSIGMAPSMFVANWLPSPKKSAESRNAFTC